MPDKPARTPENEQAESPTPTTVAAKTSLSARFNMGKWFLIVVAASVVAHAAGIAYSRWQLHPEKSSSAEVGLGRFCFEAEPSEGGRIAKADFSLYVALLEPVDPATRQRLVARKYHVQQDVEELLRKAHSGDFEDPTLHEIKRQLREQINQAIGGHVVSEVIITDLRFRHADHHGVANVPSKSSTAWDDTPLVKPAGESGGKSAQSPADSSVSAEAETR